MANPLFNDTSSPELFCSSIELLYPVCEVARNSLKIHRRCPSVTLCFFDAEWKGAVASFVCKVFYACAEPDILKSITQAMFHAYNHGVNCPRPIESKESDLLVRVEKNSFPLLFSYPDIWAVGGSTDLDEIDTEYQDSSTRKKRKIVASCDCYYVYLMTHIPGRLFSEVEGRTDAQRWTFGYAAGRLSNELSTLSCEAIKKRWYDYDWKSFLNLRKFLRSPSVRDDQLQKYFNRTFNEFELHVAPRIDTMKCGVCHNDCTPNNFIFNEDTYVPNSKECEDFVAKNLGRNQLPGIIDFDDTCYGPYVFELAIAVAHEMVVSSASDSTGYLSAASPVMEGFLSAFPLPGDELDLLCYIIPARLVQVYIGLRVNVREDCNCSSPHICPYLKCAQEIRRFMILFFNQDRESIRKHLQCKS